MEFEKVREFVRSHYGLSAGNVAPLEGYGGENYRVETSRGNFVLKLHDPDSEPNFRELLEAETSLLRTLTDADCRCYPSPQPDLDGNLLAFDVKRGKFFRLLTFIEGDLMAGAEHTDELLHSFGAFLAEMNLKMIVFRNVAVEARRFKWDLSNYRLSERHTHLIGDVRDRKLVEYFFLQNRENVEPILDGLRKSVIHGDANDWNVLVAGGKVRGIIDFGDISYTQLINELAIALTYGILGKVDPIASALQIVRGYHEKLPLEEAEIPVLYYLIATRLAVSVSVSAYARSTTNFTDYMAVSETSALELLRKWIRINPLKFENEIRVAVGLDSKTVGDAEKDLATRRKYTSRALSLHFRDPIKMTRAAFQYMYDSRGNTYLDCYNNVPQVGHCHPRVVEAGRRAMARLNTNSRYLSDAFNKYALNLLAKFPADLNKVFFVNSGSAASDLAIRLALTNTGNQGIVVIEHGYHGNTSLGIDISHYKYAGKGGSGKAPNIIEAAIPDTYKGKYTANEPNPGKRYASDLFDELRKIGSNAAAFIAEPVVGCGGQVPLAEGYLREVYPYIRANGGVCISDEVQTGFGRLGNWFWGFEMHGVVPDIVVLGKPIGNGHPMAAVVTTAAIAESFETGMEFFSSFGGNDVSCAIGQAVLDVLEDEKLRQNSAEVGALLKELLNRLVERHEVCGDARGEGLFLGLELVIDKRSKKPATELASAVRNSLKENHVLVGTDGPFDNVIKIKPPICFTRENAEELAANIDMILGRLR